MRHAREEYLFQLVILLERIVFNMTMPSPQDHHADFTLIPMTCRLSIYVLESSNSRRLTYFMPPLVSHDPVSGFTL